jgi:hypothetical protein
LTGDGVGVFGIDGEITQSLQMSFLPDLMQVNLVPPEVVLAPAFLQVDPNFTVEFADGVIASEKIERVHRRAIFLFIRLEINQRSQ